ncbi:TPA: hypothetical protein N0F65_008724, partial [Lagenidium giganteum]
IPEPDGLSIHYWGPVEGRRCDVTILRLSKVLDEFAILPALRGQFVYGDPAYAVSRYIVAPYKGGQPIPREQESNARSSGRVKTMWAAVDFRKQIKIFLSLVGKVVHLAAFFTNLLSKWQPNKSILSIAFTVYLQPL